MFYKNIYYIKKKIFIRTETSCTIGTIIHSQHLRVSSHSCSILREGGEPKAAIVAIDVGSILSPGGPTGDAKQGACTVERKDRICCCRLPSRGLATRTRRPSLLARVAGLLEAG